MNVEKAISDLTQQVKELKGMIAQLAPVRVEPSIDQEIEAIRSRGEDLGTYFKNKGKGKK